jgi:hypothetical protein
MFDSLFLRSITIRRASSLFSDGYSAKVLSVDQIENVIISSVFFCLSLKFQVTSKLPKLSGCKYTTVR